MAGHKRNHKVELPIGLHCVECPEPVEGQAFVYMLYVSNGTFYIGYSKDVRGRLSRHIAGTGARHTNLLKQFSLVFVEGPFELALAVKRERQLKKWSRAKKLALIRGDIDELKRLSRSRDQ